ncbi:carbon-nitrogen hydrolase family protein [Alicyclobacillus fodiniaquatilis]|jgi:predicted amidohydrolase|uniref:Carbon-nitrogen hydrolase family protein n=1 Tax=Alicyclobacillus fodiniaquatilis TaxID=1661150 RepID=A0ABW4JQC3_9BACL
MAYGGLVESGKQAEDIVTVASVNFHAVWGDKAGNLARIKSYIKAAAKRGADIILFPETALTGYGIDDEHPDMQKQNAETIPGPATDEIAELTQMYGVFVVLGMPERDGVNDDILYNSAAVIGPEGVIGGYRKIHPAGTESKWAAKGTDPLLFSTPWGPVGVGICYDTYCFPELARYYAALGARLYLNPTAVSDIEGWKELYYTQLKSRAIENAMYVASSNLVGQDLNAYFPGGSLVSGPSFTIGSTYYGEPIENREDIVLATIDLALAHTQRERLPLFTNNSITGIPDWRPDIYADMLKVWSEVPELVK